MVVEKISKKNLRSYSNMGAIPKENLMLFLGVRNGPMRGEGSKPCAVGRPHTRNLLRCWCSLQEKELWILSQIAWNGSWASILEHTKLGKSFSFSGPPFFLL